MTEPDRSERKPRSPIARTDKRIYEYLSEHGGQSIPRIAATLEIDRQKVLRTLRNLEKRGKVQLSQKHQGRPYPTRVVPLRVPDRIRKIYEYRVMKSRAFQVEVRGKQEEIKKRRKQMLEG